jgi:hypothetical protein
MPSASLEKPRLILSSVYAGSSPLFLAMIEPQGEMSNRLASRLQPKLGASWRGGSGCFSVSAQAAKKPRPT